MKKILFAIFPFVFLFGCSSYVSRYFFGYERIDESTKSLFQKDETYARYNNYFEDDFVKLHLDCDPYELGFYLINKTKDPLRIVWDSVKIYSDYLGKNPIPIIHTNLSQDKMVVPDSSAQDYVEINTLVKLRKEDSLSVLKPAIILAEKTWIDELVAKKNQYFLPYKLSNSDSLNNISNKVIGKKIKLILPIQIVGEIKYYSFSFTVKEFQILKKG